jgi:hypothetical protein
MIRQSGGRFGDKIMRQIHNLLLFPIFAGRTTMEMPGPAF